MQTTTHADIQPQNIETKPVCELSAPSHLHALQLLANREAGRKRTCQVTEPPSWCCRDVYIQRFCVSEALRELDGTPAVVQALFPDGRLTVHRGYIADRGTGWVDIQRCDLVDLEHATLVLEVLETTVCEAARKKLLEMRQPGALANEALLAKVLQAPAPAQRPDQVTTSTTSSTSVAVADPQTDRPSSIPDGVTLSSPPCAPASDSLSSPEHVSSEVALLASQTADLDVRFVLAAPGAPAAAFAAQACASYRKKGKTVLLVGVHNRTLDHLNSRKGPMADLDLAGLRIGSFTWDEERRPLIPRTPWTLVCQKHPGQLRRLQEADAAIGATVRQAQCTADGTTPVATECLASSIRHSDAVLADLHAASENETSIAALVVGNVPSALLSPAVMGRTFDAVVVLDAHLARPDQVVALLGLATEAVCLIGDCRSYQVPDGHSHCVQDIFDVCGVTRNIDAGVLDPRLVPLRWQENTHPDITLTVSSFAYRGLLINEEPARPARTGEDLTARGVVVFDTSQVSPAAYEFAGEDSRFDPMTAVLAYDTYCRHSEDCSHSERTLLVTPYGWQHRLHVAMIRDTRGRNVEASLLDSPLRAPVEHVVLDLTDAPGVSRPGWKLSSNAQSTALRWLTQVLTSATRKVSVLAHVPFLLDTLPADSVLRLYFKQVERLYDTGLSSQLVGLPLPPNLVEYGTWAIPFEDRAWQTLHRDVAKATSRIVWHFSADAVRRMGRKLKDRILVRSDGISQTVVADLDYETLRGLVQRGGRVFPPRVSEVQPCPEDDEFVTARYAAPLEGEDVWVRDARRCELPCVLIDEDVLWLGGSRWKQGRGQPYLRFKGKETVGLLTDYFGLGYLNASTRRS